jgi:hypothetical protein
MTIVPHVPYFSLFLQLKIELKGRHFVTTEVIEAESQEAQEVLNNLTEHDFLDAFKNGSSVGNGAYACKVTTLRVMVARRPKVIIQMEAPVPEIMGNFLYYLL